MNGDPAFQAARRELLAEYTKLNPNGFRVATAPVISVATLTYDFLQAMPAGAVVMGHAVARANQNVEWFGFGIGENYNQGAGLPPRAATDADTNQSRGKRTNGVTDMVIEGISLSIKGVRVQYAAADIPAAVLAGDPDVLAAYSGTAKLTDPGALIGPPELVSPLTLEETFGLALLPQLSLTLSWDRGRQIPIGKADQIPEGGGKSFLRANGFPSTKNRFTVSEGYLWRRTDKPDGDFTVKGLLAERNVIPVTLVALGGAAAPLVMPVRAFVDVEMRVHGIGLSQLGTN